MLKQTPNLLFGIPDFAKIIVGKTEPIPVAVISNPVPLDPTLKICTAIYGSIFK